MLLRIFQGIPKKHPIVAEVQFVEYRQDVSSSSQSRKTLPAHRHFPAKPLSIQIKFDALVSGWLLQEIENVHIILLSANYLLRRQSNDISPNVFTQRFPVCFGVPPTSEKFSAYLYLGFRWEYEYNLGICAFYGFPYHVLYFSGL